MSNWSRLLAIVTVLFATDTTSAAPLYATSVVESSGSIRGDAFIPNVLGLPDLEVTDFLSIGLNPGHVVVGFDEEIGDDVGDDLFFHLLDWLAGEEFRVLASLDGIVFSLVGISGLASGEVNKPAVVSFDLADAGLARANFVRIENLSALSPFSGPDIDAIEGRQVQVTAPEPTTTALLTLALLGAGCRRRRIH